MTNFTPPASYSMLHKIMWYMRTREAHERMNKIERDNYNKKNDNY